MAVMIRRAVRIRTTEPWDDESEPVVRHEPLLRALYSKPKLEFYLTGPSQFWRDEIRLERLQAHIAAKLPMSLQRRVDFQVDGGPLTTMRYVEYTEPDDDIAW